MSAGLTAYFYGQKGIINKVPYIMTKNTKTLILASFRNAEESLLPPPALSGCEAD